MSRKPLRTEIPLPPTTLVVWGALPPNAVGRMERAIAGAQGVIITLHEDVIALEIVKDGNYQTYQFWLAED